MEMTIRDFSAVCETFKNGLEMYDRTEKVYNFLKANKGKEFSPKEIARNIGFSYQSHFSDEIVHYDLVVKPLHWLLQMGLVGRNEYTERITIEFGYEKRIKDVKIIDGIKYVGYIYKSMNEIDSTFYKWFVL